MNKRIVIICHNYFPEMTSTGLYTTLMAEFLCEKGWQVTMITGFPHYPNWEIFADYRKKPRFLHETIRGVEIFRYRHYVPKEPSFANRIVHLLDFTAGSYLQLGKIREADVVLSIIPFTSAAWLGKKLAARHGAKHWIHVQDFEFDAARESGMVSAKGGMKRVFRLLHSLEKKLLDSSDMTSTISSEMMQKLQKRTSARTSFFPNWIDSAVIDPKKAAKHPFLKSEKFKVLYAGNIGEKQDWKLFLEVAEHFRHDTRIEFIVVGDGATRKSLERRISGMQRVHLYHPVPMEQLNDLLCSANLHILFQKSDVMDTVMPSKILGMMASTIPCLVTGNPGSEIERIFRECGEGTFISSDHKENVIAEIQSLLVSRERDKRRHPRSREYVCKWFGREHVLNTFLLQLDSLYGN